MIYFNKLANYVKVFVQQSR